MTYYVFLTCLLLDNLQEYLHLLEEAKKRDHRLLLGQSQELFFFSINLGTVAILLDFISFHLLICRSSITRVLLDLLFTLLQLCSPGSCFFLPNGAIIYNKLMDFLRQQYRERGYQEVSVNLLYNN